MHFFRDETPLGRFFNAAGDIIITNLLFILLCVPLVTIGAAISGLEYFHLKRRRGSDESAPKLLMQGFRMNFKQSTIGWLILCLLFYLVTVNLNAFGQDGPMENQALYIISMAAAAFILFLPVTFSPWSVPSREVSGHWPPTRSCSPGSTRFPRWPWPPCRPFVPGSPCTALICFWRSSLSGSPAASV